MRGGGVRQVMRTISSRAARLCRTGTSTMARPRCCRARTNRQMLLLLLLMLPLPLLMLMLLNLVLDKLLSSTKVLVTVVVSFITAERAACAHTSQHSEPAHTQHIKHPRRFSSRRFERFSSQAQCGGGGGRSSAQPARTASPAPTGTRLGCGAASGTGASSLMMM